MHEFGRRLGQQRARLGLTQAELAARTGIARRTQINYERGERAPDVTYLAQLSALGIALSELLGLTPDAFGANGPKASESIPTFSIGDPPLERAREAIVVLLSDPALRSRLAHGDAAMTATFADAVIALVEVSPTLAAIEANRQSVLRLIRG